MKNARKTTFKYGAQKSIFTAFKVGILFPLFAGISSIAQGVQGSQITQNSQASQVIPGVQSSVAREDSWQRPMHSQERRNNQRHTPQRHVTYSEEAPRTRTTRPNNNRPVINDILADQDTSAAQSTLVTAPPQKSLWADAVPHFSRPKKNFRIYAHVGGGSPKNDNNPYFQLGALGGGGFGITAFATEHFALDLFEMISSQKSSVTQFTMNTFTFNPQYHMWPDRLIDPYIGIGGAVVVPLKFPSFFNRARPSIGFDIQFGANIKLPHNFYIGLDVKRIWGNFILERGSRDSGHYVSIYTRPWIATTSVGWAF